MNPLMMAMQGANAQPQQNSEFMAEAMKAYKNGTINQFGEKQFQENPQFRQFVENMRGKDPFQIARANGIDLARFMR